MTPLKFTLMMISGVSGALSLIGAILMCGPNGEEFTKFDVLISCFGGVLLMLNFFVHCIELGKGDKP